MTLRDVLLHRIEKHEALAKAAFDAGRIVEDYYQESVLASLRSLLRRLP